MVGVMLSDCPNLVEFSAGVVEVERDGLLTSNAPGRVARDSLTGPPISSRPWACTGLRRIRFAGLKWSEDDAVNDKFLDRRLAALKELEGFTIGGLDEDYNDHPDREVFLESEVLTRLNHRGGPLWRVSMTGKR